MFTQANRRWFQNCLEDSVAAADPEARPEADPASQPEDLRSLFYLDKKETSPFQDFGHPLEKARRFVAYADQYQVFTGKITTLLIQKKLSELLIRFAKIFNGW